MCYLVPSVSFSLPPSSSLQRSNHTRKMTLLHFKAWPKNGRPPLSSVILMLQVMERMAKGREASAEQQGPVVVMCKWARIHSCTGPVLCVCVMAVSTSYAQFLHFSLMFHSLSSFVHFPSNPVTLSDGMSRSGVFITCMTEIERVKVEGGVDIFQTVKAARAQRPHMVNNCVSEWTCPYPCLGTLFIVQWQ